MYKNREDYNAYQREYQKKLRAECPNKWPERKRKWVDRNREKVNAYSSEYQKEYRKKNRKKLNAKARKKYWEKKDQLEDLQSGQTI